MDHCWAGTGPYAFDWFTPIQTWVEQGTAPDSMTAAHFDASGAVDRTRRLCAYPQVARYNGDGSSIDEATNFRCVDPPNSH